MGVDEVRRILGDYRKREGHSPVLVERLVGVEKALVDEHFDVSRAARSVRKPAKKQGSGKPVVSGASDKSDKSDKSTKPDLLKVGPGTN